MERPLTWTRARARPAALLLAGLLAPLGCRASGDRPGLVLFPDMVRSVPYDSYDPSPVTRSGQTLLLPPEGTVPLGTSPFPYGPGPEEARRAGAELANPVAPTPASLARGREVYETVCIVCHGAKGEGDGPVIGPGRFPNPPSLLAEHARGLPDGQIVHIVTYGQGIMPSHSPQVLPRDRWRVALYVRKLQGSLPPPAAAPAPGAPGGSK
jgi:mono/diheme cytochrome c family protein